MPFYKYINYGILNRNITGM